jgi:putative addiction module component (TIGR02574 family)
MTPTPENILQWALALPEDDRAMIADGLLESLEAGGEDNPEERTAWEAEIKTRVEDIRSGRVKGIPSEEVWKRLEGKLHGPPTD